MEKPRAVQEMVAAFVLGQIQNADAGDPWSERLPARRQRRLSTLHDAATAQGAVEDVVFPGRRPLGAQTAELAAMVQDRERLGRSVVQVILVMSGELACRGV